MNSQILSFMAGLIAFVFYVIVFLVLMRLRTKMGWLALQVLVASIIHILTSILFSFLIDDFLYWYTLGIFSVGWFCFFTLSTAVYVSISARIVRIIYKHPVQALPLNEVFRISVMEPFKERAEFLVASGFAQKGISGYIITSSGSKNAQRINWLRQLFGMEESGLYSLSKKNER